ncbi:lactonase family protein [bacterium]|nr:lactonase family protein [bacterium]
MISASARHRWFAALSFFVGTVVTMGEETLPITVYVGTYTGKGSEGIYRCQLDPAQGKLQVVGVTKGIESPSFLAFHPSKKYLYAVSEVEIQAGKKTGGVSALSIDPTTHELTLINQQASGGSGPCHLSVDATGQVVLVANYGAGSVASLPIEKNGQLKPAVSLIQHQGKSVNQQRQSGPHAHSINVDPTNRFAVAADLGTDKIFVYRLDTEAATITPNEPPAVTTPLGGGPRHLAFHPKGKFAYANNELTSSVNVLAWNAQAGVFEVIQTISTLPTNELDLGNTTAEVLVHPNGQFVYVSNRGNDSVAGFRVDQESGKLTVIGHTKTGGKTPRNIGIDPTGTFLLAANQDSDSVVVFRINKAEGTLQSTGSSVAISMPVCVKFLD